MLDNSEAEASNPPDNSTKMARTAPRSFSNEHLPPYLTEKNHSVTPQDIGISSEITNLISKVGSAEVVIAYLLREKKSQAAQNSQLWRLVDKQRAMTLGLNKDLERALRDKERYRKKLREFVAKASSIESGNSNEKLNSHDEIEAEVSENFLDDENDLESPSSLVLAPYPITPKSENFSYQCHADISRTTQAEAPCPLEDIQTACKPLQVDTNQLLIAALIED